MQTLKIKQNYNKINGTNQTKNTDTENRVAGKGGTEWKGGWGRVKWVKGSTAR